MSARPRRLGLYVPWALFVAFCVAWTAYWGVVRDGARKALDMAADGLRASGADLTYSSVRFSGFPLHLTMTLSQARLQSSGGLTIATDVLPISVNLSNPLHVIVGFASPIYWSRGAEAYALVATGGEMSVRIDAGRSLQRASIVLTRPTVTRGGATVASADTLALHVRPDPRRNAAIQLVFETENQQAAGSLKSLCPCKAFRAAISAPAPQTLDLARWRGPFRIERFDVETGGQTFIGDGVLSLDDRRRPEGDITAVAGDAKIPLHAGNGWWSIAGARVAAAEPIQLLPD